MYAFFSYKVRLCVQAKRSTTGRPTHALYIVMKYFFNLYKLDSGQTKRYRSANNIFTYIKLYNVIIISYKNIEIFKLWLFIMSSSRMSLMNNENCNCIYMVVRIHCTMWINILFMSIKGIIKGINGITFLKTIKVIFMKESNQCVIVILAIDRYYKYP